MSDACYCDLGDGAPIIYEAERVKARIAHKCYECGRAINPGDRYERARMLFDGSWQVDKTCARCLDARDYITAHAPCFCWLHGSMLDDARAVIDEHGHASAGFYIGAMKRVLRAERHQTTTLRAIVRAAAAIGEKP